MNMWSLLNLFVDGKKSLVPLTSSVYVESELIGCDRVLVDIGTGYYIEQVCMNFSVLNEYFYISLLMMLNCIMKGRLSTFKSN